MKASEIDEHLATGKIEGSRRWYVNRQGQTMSIIVGPVEFLMGSPPDEALRPASEAGREIQHKRRISRSFAIATKEVTVEQFRRFRKEHKYDKFYVPGMDCPVNTVSWYEAAEYCNWLSEKEGLKEDQWCYLPNEAGKYEEGMKTPPNYLQRSGYRLPTEAEWEYACRADAVTAFSFGQSDELLEQYAWYSKNSNNYTHPVGLLKPNDLGLFDMHGNVWELCQDISRLYPQQQEGVVIEDNEDLPCLSPDTRRLSSVLRGGSFSMELPFMRAASRSSSNPTYRGPNGGFRPARTIVP